MARDKTKCPWCGGKVRGYDALVKKLSKPDEYEAKKIEEYLDKPLRTMDKQLLAAMGLGADALQLNSHPWIEGGGIISSYSLYKLEGRKMIERRAQKFTDRTMGTAWTITALGLKFIENMFKEKNDG